MARVRIDNDTLHVEMEGLDRLWALKSRISVPMSKVRGATIDPGFVAERKGLRGPGANVRRLLTAGTFRVDGQRVFWDVHSGDNAVVIELTGADYGRLVLDVEDPRATVDLIERATR